MSLDPGNGLHSRQRSKMVLIPQHYNCIEVITTIFFYLRQKVVVWDVFINIKVLKNRHDDVIIAPLPKSKHCTGTWRDVQTDFWHAF